MRHWRLCGPQRAFGAESNAEPFTIWRRRSSTIHHTHGQIRQLHFQQCHMDLVEAAPGVTAKRTDQVYADESRHPWDPRQRREREERINALIVAPPAESNRSFESLVRHRSLRVLSNDTKSVFDKAFRPLEKNARSIASAVAQISNEIKHCRKTLRQTQVKADIPETHQNEQAQQQRPPSSASVALPLASRGHLRGPAHTRRQFLIYQHRAAVISRIVANIRRRIRGISRTLTKISHIPIRTIPTASAPPHVTYYHEPHPPQTLSEPSRKGSTSRSDISRLRRKRLPETFQDTLAKARDKVWLEEYTRRLKLLKQLYTGAELERRKAAAKAEAARTPKYKSLARQLEELMISEGGRIRSKEVAEIERDMFRAREERKKTKNDIETLFGEIEGMKPSEEEQQAKSVSKISFHKQGLYDIMEDSDIGVKNSNVEDDAPSLNAVRKRLAQRRTRHLRGRKKAERRQKTQHPKPPRIHSWSLERLI